MDRGNRDKDCFICGAGKRLVTYRVTGIKTAHRHERDGVVRGADEEETSAQAGRAERSPHTRVMSVGGSVHLISAPDRLAELPGAWATMARLSANEYRRAPRLASKAGAARGLCSGLLYGVYTGGASSVVGLR